MKRYRTLGVRALFLLIAGCVLVRALAEDSAPAIDPAAFGLFADEQINGSITRNEFPGAAIVLVQDGTITFARGYGVADLQSHQPVDPMTTGFRVGSISKLITVVATLQLVERGKLSLTDEIQSRLPDVPLADAGKGVTIHNLLTHTDGFEVGWSIGGAVRDERDAVSLATFLQTHVPRRIVPPGQVYVYSDVGMALAGHIVENVDGRPFAKYAREEILDPLGMTRSTFDQPLPNPIATNLATGYRKFKGEYQRHADRACAGISRRRFHHDCGRHGAVHDRMSGRWSNWGPDRRPSSALGRHDRANERAAILASPRVAGDVLWIL